MVENETRWSEPTLENGPTFLSPTPSIRLVPPRLVHTSSLEILDVRQALLDSQPFTQFRTWKWTFPKLKWRKVEMSERNERHEWTQWLLTPTSCWHCCCCSHSFIVNFVVFFTLNERMPVSETCFACSFHSLAFILIKIREPERREVWSVIIWANSEWQVYCEPFPLALSHPIPLTCGLARFKK